LHQCVRMNGEGGRREGDGRGERGREEVEGGGGGRGNEGLGTGGGGGGCKLVPGPRRLVTWALGGGLVGISGGRWWEVC